MSRPRVVYSVGVRLGTNDSLSLVAANAIAALDQAGYLQRILVSTARPGAVPADRLRQLGLLHRIWRRLEIYDPTGYMGWLDNVWFDAWASRRLPDANLLHVWHHCGLATLAEARRRGLLTLVERGSSHTLTQQRLLQEEYARFGMRLPPIPGVSVRRALAEFRLADRVLVPSDFARQSFVQQGYPADQLIQVPFGVDTQRYIPAAAEPSGRFRAIFAGQVSLRKGLPYLLQAWDLAGLPDADLTIVGNPLADARAVIQPYLKRPDIQWISYTPQLGELLQQASVFIFPSIEEGSALVTYIALACGLPVITTPNAGSVVRDGIDGRLVPIRDPEALAAALRELYSDTRLRTAMRQAARQQAELHSWPHYRGRLIAAYDQLFAAR